MLQTVPHPTAVAVALRCIAPLKPVLMHNLFPAKLIIYSWHARSECTRYENNSLNMNTHRQLCTPCGDKGELVPVSPVLAGERISNSPIGLSLSVWYSQLGKEGGDLGFKPRHLEDSLVDIRPGTTKMIKQCRSPQGGEVRSQSFSQAYLCSLFFQS